MGTSASILSYFILLLAHVSGHLAVASAKRWHQTHDYIVVGAGSAGAVVANRLSEDQHVRVLLLEAGGNETPLSEVPIMAGGLQQSPLDWAYRTVPQKHCCSALEERRMTWARGKVLGGTSAINYMLYVRGNQRDYDRWAHEEGAEGWSWYDVLPYFLRAENMSDQQLGANFYHSTKGLQTVSCVDHSCIRPASAAFIEAGKQLGYRTGDYNGATQALFALPQTTIRNGLRCSTNKAYLRPAKSRRNLEVVTNAHATRILLRSDSGMPVAHGVEFVKDGLTSQAFAGREIIVSAGALNSPQLLMLSGIGPAEHLRELGIPVLADLPVGNNLQDHAYPALVFTVDKGQSPRVMNCESGVADLLQFIIARKGPIAQGGGVEAFGFIKTEHVNQSDDYPDFQIHLFPNSPADLSLPLKRTQGITDSFYNCVFAPHKSEEQFSMLITLLRPESRGTVRLASTDPYEPPIFDPNYLSAKEDLDSMVAAMKVGIELGETEPMRKIGAKLLPTKYPECREHELYSDDYLACMARSYLGTLWHMAGTCRMGRQDDPRAVVDPRLRVKGVRGLRVVDVSIMPTVVSGNTNAPAIMIGEKASDMIKEDNYARRAFY